jgi:hypothetical protein
MSDSEFPQLIASRYDYWTAQGYFGKALFEQMAKDDQLPFMFAPAQSAVVLGSTTGGLKLQRARRTGPPFVRLTGKLVAYPRVDLFQFLSQRYVGHGTG